MKSSKTILSVFFLLLATTNAFSQTDSKDVSITSSGSGKTLEDAKQAALRSSVEQAFGAFISSKTEMFNDRVVADQMTSVTSGNIKSYEVLNESQLPDGSWGVTLKTIVSVDKLTSFVEAKGIAIEIKGGLFALNIKQQLLNEQAEYRAVCEMVGLLYEPMQTSWDYEIVSRDPFALSGDSKNWGIKLEVYAKTNKNYNFCRNYIYKTLDALSLSSEEVKKYKNLNLPVQKVYIVNLWNNVVDTFYLRNSSSLRLLWILKDSEEYNTRLFTVQSGMDKLNANFESDYISQRKYYYPGEIMLRFWSYWGSEGISSDTTTGKKVVKFSFVDKRTLSQIEQMTGYTVKPIGVVSQFKHGGFVVYEKNGHGLVAAIDVLLNLPWKTAKTACDELMLNGYSDWRLPSKEELNAIYNNLVPYLAKMGSYWSSTEYDKHYMWIMDDGILCNYRCPTNSSGRKEVGENHVRAVRAF